MYRLISITLIALIFLNFNGYAQYNHYYGNIHSHTSYSDGSQDAEVSNVKTPKQAFEFAKQSKHLDFLGISEHNHSKAGMNMPNYAKGLQQADEANDDGTFVAMYGMEFGTVKLGHVLIYGVKQLINWEEGNSGIECTKGDYNQLWAILNENPNCFATLAHPGKNNFSNLKTDEYSEIADKVICGCAVRNGPHKSPSVNYDNPPDPQSFYYPYYVSLLQKGYRVGPTIDHDNHYTTFGRHTQGRTVVLAESLTRDNIIDAYQKMRFYATDDFNIEVDYTVDGHYMGENVKGSEMELHVSIKDEDNEDVESVDVVYGTVNSNLEPKVLITETAKKFDYTVEILPEEDIYMYLDITQKDGDKIYTSPIWIKGLNVQ